MQGVSEAVYELLKDYADGRVHNLRAPQNVETPYLVFSVSPTETDNTLTGSSGYWSSTLQIDIYSHIISDIRDIQAQISAALENYNGIVYYGSGSPKDSISIVLTHNSESEFIDQTDEPFLYRSSGNWSITKGGL